MPFENINDPWRNEEEAPEIKAAPPRPQQTTTPTIAADQTQQAVQPSEAVQTRPVSTPLEAATSAAFAMQRDKAYIEADPWKTPPAIDNGNEARFDETPPDPGEIAPTPNDPYELSDDTKALVDAARAGWGPSFPDGNGGSRSLTAQDVKDYRAWRWQRMKDLETKFEYIKDNGGTINNDPRFDADKFYEENIRGNRVYADNLTDRGAKSLDALQKRIDEKYESMVSERGIGQIAYDSIRRAAGDAAKFGREIYNFVGVQTGAMSKAEWAANERRAREIEERVKALHPTKVGGIEDINSLGDAGIWLMERIGEQSINLASCFLGGGIAAAGVKGAARVGIGAAAKVAARSQAARMAVGWGGTAFFNAGDVIGQASDEALARGETVSALRVLPEAAGYIALDNFGATIRGLRRLGGANIEKMAVDAAGRGFLASGRQVVRTLPRAAREFGKDVLFEGATEAIQSGVVTRLANFLTYGTAFSQDELNAEGGPGRAATMNALNEFFAGAAVAAIPGVATTTLKARSDRRTLVASDRVLSRFANKLTDNQLRKMAASEAAGPLGRLFSDLQEGKLANANLEAYDRVLLANALASDILARQMSRSPAMSDKFKANRDKAIAAMGEDAQEWYRAYTGGWTYGQSIEDVPEMGAGQANSPDTGVSDRARANLVAEVGYFDHNTESPLFYTDGEGSGDVGRIAFSEFTETDENGKKHRVIRVSRLDGGPMPFGGANEFHADDFGGEIAMTREAALAYGCDLSSWIKYTDSLDSQVVDSAKEYLSRNGRGGEAVNIVLVGSAEEAATLLAKMSYNPDASFNEQMFGSTKNGTKNAATGLARGFRGVTLPGSDGNTIILNRNMINGAVDLAAVLDHEMFHSEFSAFLERNGSSLRKELGLPEKIAEGSQMEKLIFSAVALGVLSKAEAKNFTATKESVDALKKAVESKEEDIAYAAERIGSGLAQRVGGKVVEAMRKSNPELASSFADFFSERFGRMAQNDAELGDYIAKVVADAPRGAEGSATVGMAERIADPEQRRRQFLSAFGVEPEPSPAPAPEPEPSPQPTPAPAPEPAPSPSPAPSTEPAPEPELAPSEPAPAPQPEPKPSPPAPPPATKRISYGSVSVPATDAQIANWNEAQKPLAKGESLEKHRFNVVQTQEAPFKTTDEGVAWAEKNGVVGTMTNEESGGKGEITISKSSVKEMLNPEQRKKSPSAALHNSALASIRDIIRESVVADVHLDHKKGKDGKRSPSNGINADVAISVLYGAMRGPDGKTYRVKTTLKRYADPNESAKAYAYHISEVEVLAGKLGQTENGSAPNTRTSTSVTGAIAPITGKNLLQGIRDVNGNLLVSEKPKAAPTAPAPKEEKPVAPKKKSLMKPKAEEAKPAPAPAPKNAEAPAPAKPVEAPKAEEKKPAKKIRRGRDFGGASVFASDRSLNMAGMSRFASDLSQELSQMEDTARAMNLPGGKRLELTDGFTIGGLRRMFNNDSARVASFLELINRAGRLKKVVRLSEAQLKAGMETVARDERLARETEESKAERTVREAKRTVESGQKVSGRKGTAFMRANQIRTDNDKALTAGLSGRHSIAKARPLSKAAENIAARAIAATEERRKGKPFDKLTPAGRATLLAEEIIPLADDMATQSLDAKDRADMLRHLGSLLREADPKMADSLLGPNRKVSLYNPLLEAEMDEWTYENTSDALALRELSTGGDMSIPDILRGVDGQSDIAADIRNPFSVNAVLRAIEAVCERPGAPAAMFERRDALRNRLAQILIGRAELARLDRNALEVFNRERALLDERLDLRDFKAEVAKEPISAFDIDADRGLKRREGQLNPDVDIADPTASSSSFYAQVDAALGNETAGEEAQDRGVIPDGAETDAVSSIERDSRNADVEYAGVDTGTQDRGGWANEVGESLTSDWTDTAPIDMAEDAGFGSMFASEESLQTASRFYDPDAIVNIVDGRDAEDLSGMSTADLRRYLKNKYQGMEVTIKADGTSVLFVDKGLRASLKKRDFHRKPLSILDKLVEESRFTRHETVDSLGKHKHLKGQLVYTAALRLADGVYAVEIKLDDPKLGDKKHFKGQTLKTKIADAVLSVEPRLKGPLSTSASEASAVESVRLGDIAEPQTAPDANRVAQEREDVKQNPQDPSGVQKSADVTYPDAGAEISSFRFASIGSQRRAEMARLLGKHRPDLNAGEVVSELEKFGTVKEQKVALHWVIRGGLALPQDAYKVADALSVADKANVDPFRYKSPDELLLANKDFKPSARPIDPATVPELSDARDEGDGIVSYLVQDDRQGQAAMRRIIDTHWGENANPWCLLARTEEQNRDRSDYETTRAFEDWLDQNYKRLHNEGASPNEWGDIFERETGRKAVEFIARQVDELHDAWRWWQNYSALPKRVAFKNGRLLSFMATERGQGDGKVEFSKPENERRVESFYKEYSKIDKDERPGNFQQWMMEEHPAEYDAIAEDEEDGGDAINAYQYNRVNEEWWDRQDESHADLDWARDGVGRSMFASEASQSLADPNLVAAALSALRVKNEDGTWSISTRVRDLLRYERIANADPKYRFWKDRTKLTQVWQEAKAALTSDPGAAQAAVSRALSYENWRGNGRARFSVSAQELALLRANLMVRKAEVKQTLDALFDAEAKGEGNIQQLKAAQLAAEEKLSEAVHATALAESAAGTALGSLSRLVDEDMSLVDMMRKADREIANTKGISSENRGPLTAEEVDRLRRLENENERLRKKNEALEKQVADAAREGHVGEKIDGAVREAKKRKAAGQKSATVAEAVEAARNAVAGIVRNFGPIDITVYPELWAQAGGIVKDIANAIIGEHLASGRSLMKLDHNAFAERLEAECRKVFGEGTTVSSDPAHRELTRRDFLDLFSDYGDVDRLADSAEKNESERQKLVAAQNRMKELARLESQLEDIRAGKIPLKAYERANLEAEGGVDEELARVRQEMQDALRESGLSSDYLHRMRTPLDAARENLENRIAEVKANLEAGEIAKKAGRKPLGGEENLADLREELRFLTMVQNATFKNRGLTDNERLAEMERLYRQREKSASDQLQRLMAGERPVMPLDMSDDGKRSAWAHADAEWRQRAAEARRAAAAASRDLNSLKRAMQSESYRYEKALADAIARREDLIVRWEEALNAGRVTLSTDAERYAKQRRGMKYERALTELEREKKQLYARRDAEIARIAFDRKNKLAKAAATIWQATSLQRIVQASGDLSSIGVQCAVACLAHPVDGLKAIIPGIKAFWGSCTNKPEYVEAFFEKLRKDKDFALIADYVSIPETDGNGGFMQGSTEEFFKRQAIQDRFPKILGVSLFDNRYIRASEAGFNVPVALIRFSLAKRLLAQLRETKGENYTPTDDEMTLLGNVVNAATGKGRWLADGSKINLSGLLWAASRVSGQVESIALPARLIAAEGVEGKFKAQIAKELMLKPMANFVAVMAMLGLSHALFKDDDDDDPFLQWDPHNSKFLKAKIGNRYISLTGGLEQYAVLATKAITGVKHTGGGKSVSLRGGDFGQSFSQELFRFVKNKLRPDLGLALQWLDAKDAQGNEIKPKLWGTDGRLYFLVNNTVLPLTLGDIIDAGKDIYDNGSATTMALASIAVLGYNGSTQGETPYKRDKARVDAADKIRRDMENGVEGADERYARLVADLSNHRYVAASKDKKAKALAKRITELDDAIRRGEPVRAKKNGPIQSRRELTRAERKAAEKEMDALEQQYHDLLWPELRKRR